MSEIKFGTDGWRAIIAQDFTFQNVKIVTQGIANYIKSCNLGKKGVVIGYDNRFLSEKFALEAARVLLGNGIKTMLLRKAAPTPVTAFAIRQMEAGGAIMITASHNPPEYNGIKFIPEYAGPALPEVTEAIEEELHRIEQGGKIYEIDIEEAIALDLLKEIDVDREYISQLNKIVNPDFFKNKPLRVVVDPMYGAGIGYLDKILMELGCEVKTINNYRDTLFGGSMPEPTDSGLSDLKRAVQTYKADLGLAMDGDADRFGIIDAEGNFVTPNRFAYLLFEHLLQTRTFRGPVCRSVATTHMLDHIAKNNGLTVIETPVGFKYIGEALREKGCMLGIEESGGLSIFGHIPEKDGILACLLAVEMVAYAGQTLQEMTEDFAVRNGRVISNRFDIKTDVFRKPKILQYIQEYQPKSIAGKKVEKVSEVEGKKYVMEDGSWVLIRASGTEPLFRIYVEASTEENLLQINNEVQRAIGLLAE